MDRWRRRGTWVALVVGLLWALAGCGAGESTATGPEFDLEGATAAVEEGKQALVDLLDGQPVEVPYFELTGIDVVFQQAQALDPTYDEARFWSSLFGIVNFLESDATRAFLAKLGWESLKGTGPASGDGEFEDFFERVGQSLGWAFASVSGGATGGDDPPLHDFGLPNDPDVDLDPNPCLDPQNLECDLNTLEWVPVPVIVFGTDAYVTVRFQELYDFITVGLGNAARGAVDRLKAIAPDFSTSITAFPLTGEGVSMTITFDAFEVKLLQAAYGVLDVIASLPTIWTYTGFDAFWSGNSERDPVTGEFLLVGQAVNDITTDEAIAYFNAGNDGIVGNGDEPLRSNPAGVTRLKQALADLLEAAQSVLARLSTGDALTGHLVTPSFIFSTYDDQPQVVAYGSKALGSMVGDARAALNGPATVRAYLPVATIQSFDTCPAVQGSIPDPDPLNTATVWAVTDPTLISVVADLDPDAAGSGHDSFTVPAAAAGAYYFRFTLAAAANVSIYTTSPDGTTVDTDGDVAYLDNNARTPALIGWDSDQDSGEGQHFGISIAAAYMDPALMPDLFEAPLTFYVQVTNVSGGEFTLHVQKQPAAGWPDTEPIFLKGGGGRNFLARTYDYGSMRVNAGAALTVASEFFDRSARNTLAYYPGDLGTPEEGDSYWELYFPAGVLRSSILSVLPDATFEPGLGGLPPATLVNLSGALTSITPGGTLLTATPTVAPSFGTSAPFCAYPKDLGTASEIAGGHLAFGFW